ncbi:hypothetical protein ACRAWC_01505 [Leifsonia sp. L25]|uniref:hypothetical protein n=1 Tax=Leifsonia sp. L25 TaxID=3423957 RepID=UPI003D68BEC5
MNEIADQLANVTSVIVMTLKEFDGVSFAQHVYELVADGEEVVLRVDMDPSGLFRDFKVRIAVAPPNALTKRLATPGRNYFTTCPHTQSPCCIWVANWRTNASLAKGVW